MDTQLTDAQTKLVAAKLAGSTSCSGCQWLYFEDTGYSSYTVTGSNLICFLNLNPNLPTDLMESFEFEADKARGIKDRAPPTCNSRCESYREFPTDKNVQVCLDVDKEARTNEYFEHCDPEVAAAYTEFLFGGPDVG